MVYLKQKIGFLIFLFFSTSSVFANTEENRSSLIIVNQEIDMKDKIVLSYNLYCESMCTTTYIQKSSLCSNLNSEKSREKCYQDAKDWEDKCLMNCK